MKKTDLVKAIHAGELKSAEGDYAALEQQFLELEARRDALQARIGWLRKQVGPVQADKSSGTTPEFSLTAPPPERTLRGQIRSIVSAYPNGVAPKDVREELIRQGFKAASKSSRIYTELWRMKTQGHVTNQDGKWFATRKQ